MFVDLDETLYPKNNGVWEAISEKINSYLITKLELSLDQAIALRQKYYKAYGTTLQGLQKFHAIDAAEYLEYVHDVPIEELLLPSPKLRSVLRSIMIRKIIFTNASRSHAERVLQRLNLSDLFNQIIDIRALNFVNKPHPQAYQRALKLSGDPNPLRCVLIDDQLQNLIPAKALGMTTILIGEGNSHKVDHTVASIEEMSENIFAHE